MRPWNKRAQRKYQLLITLLPFISHLPILLKIDCVLVWTCLADITSRKLILFPYKTSSLSCRSLKVIQRSGISLHWKKITSCLSSCKCGVNKRKNNSYGLIVVGFNIYSKFPIGWDRMKNISYAGKYVQGPPLSGISIHRLNKVNCTC